MSGVQETPRVPLQSLQPGRVTTAPTGTRIRAGGRAEITSCSANLLNVMDVGTATITDEAESGTLSRNHFLKKDHINQH